VIGPVDLPLSGSPLADLRLSRLALEKRTRSADNQDEQVPFMLDARPWLPSLDTNERILVVDDDAVVRGVLCECLRDAGHEVLEAGHGLEALEVLERQPVALVLSDIQMPQIGGLQLLEILRRTHPEVAVVMMTGLGEVRTAVHALQAGAFDYLQKPVDLSEIPFCVDRALERRRLVAENRLYHDHLERLVEERTRELADAYQQTLTVLAATLDTRDPTTGGHAHRVVALASAMARELGFSGAALKDIEWGAVLHDVGKIGIPDHILRKPGKLTEEEWVIMRTHCDIGYRLLQDVKFLGPHAFGIIRHHHERWDGGGYPAGLAGEAIPVGARIFAVVDAFDAITSDRPYRAGQAAEVAAVEIRRCAGTQFDPRVVELFLRTQSQEHRLSRAA
jgi:response regulator RpfG family c-di-GMP phosphodiesterase